MIARSPPCITPDDAKSTQYRRNVQLDNVTIRLPAKVLVGINSNYGDTARFSNINIFDPNRRVIICERYTGNNTGAEPIRIGSGADGTHCIYSSSNIIWR